MSLFLTVTEHANQAKEMLYETNTDRYDGWVLLVRPDAHVALTGPYPSQCGSLLVLRLAPDCRGRTSERAEKLRRATWSRHWLLSLPVRLLPPAQTSLPGVIGLFQTFPFSS